MSQIVRITINKKLANVLEVLRSKFPALDDSEIFKLTLSDYFSTKLQADIETTSFVNIQSIKKTASKKAVNLGKITKNLQFQRKLKLPKNQSWKDIYYHDIEQKYLKN